MTASPQPRVPATPAVTDEGIAAAKARIGRPARDTLAEVHSFAQRANGLRNAAARLRRSARDQVTNLRDQQAWAELRAKPISELRAVAGKGARLGALDEAGLHTVADVAAIPQERLQTVPGVGPASAQQVAVAAYRVWSQARAGTRFRFNPDSPNDAQTTLLGTLAAIPHADNAYKSLGNELRKFTERVEPLLTAAERSGHKTSMLLRGKQKKRAALTALAQLDALLADPGVVALREALDAQEQLVDPSTYATRQLWNDYRADAARFNALLAAVAGTGEDDTMAAQGFIPTELRRDITAVRLDTSLLTAKLRGYQAFGTQYAIHQRHVIIGDEMGLGKTLEALAAFAHLAANGQQRFLVVCPASVQMNWLNEIGKHTALTAYSLHGNERDAAARSWLRQGGVAVTTFGTLGRLEGVTDADVAMLVVDEAHYVKNPATNRAKPVAAMVRRAERTMFLTGTPMENRVEEFRRLVRYLQPTLAARIKATDAVAGATAFRRAVAPVYLRRNQEDVLTELPELIEMEDWVQFTGNDATAYARAVQSGNLMRMRQAAFHSSTSAKLEQLGDIADEAQQDGHKVVVFSNFLDFLQAIADSLGDRVIGPLTGSVAPTARQQLVTEFTVSDGHAVLLSQIEAGGVGLNVQAASIVVLTEPQWKPSTEEQAIARAHRMGQTRRVRVHRLLAKDSVDERLREVQEGKSELFTEFARKSDAKDADSRATDTAEHHSEPSRDDAVPTQQRVVLAEQHRLGIE